MKVFCYACEGCGSTDEQLLSKPRQFITCPSCGGRMYRDYRSECVSGICEEDWAQENDGRGRRQPQAEFYGKTYFRNKRELRDFIKTKASDDAAKRGNKIVIH